MRQTKTVLVYRLTVVVSPMNKMNAVCVMDELHKKMKFF